MLTASCRTVGQRGSVQSCGTVWHTWHCRGGHCTGATGTERRMSSALASGSTRVRRSRLRHARVHVHMCVHARAACRRKEGSSHLLTCPSAAVLLAHVSAMLQQHPGTLEVAQRGGQVQGSASSGVQLLDVGLPGRNEAVRLLRWPDLALQCSPTDVQLPESSQHLTVFGRAFPPLTSSK